MNYAIHPAARAVIDLQAAMLAGKTNGFIELSGLGQFTWKEFVALTDILLSGVWKSTTMDERGQLFDQWAYEAADEPRDEPGLYDGRHDGLRFLAWLFQGWPDGEGAQVARLMLGRWLFGGREFSSFHFSPKWVGRDGKQANALPAVVKKRLHDLLKMAGSTVKPHWLRDSGLFQTQSSAAELGI